MHQHRKSNLCVAAPIVLVVRRGTVLRDTCRTAAPAWSTRRSEMERMVCARAPAVILLLALLWGWLAGLEGVAAQDCDNHLQAW